MIDLNLVTKWLAIATGLLGIAAFIISIEQRKKEFRWKQAELARKLIEDLFADDDAAQGLYMLDNMNRPYKNVAGNLICASRDDVLRSIRKSLAEVTLDVKEESIMFCIDSLLYFVNRIELSLQSKLILFGDVVDPFDYYLSLMQRDADLFIEYMQKVGYRNLPRFCDRFPSWKPIESD